MYLPLLMHVVVRCGCDFVLDGRFWGDNSCISKPVRCFFFFSSSDKYVPWAVREKWYDNNFLLPDV